MTRIYWVDHGNTANIRGPYLVGQEVDNPPFGKHILQGADPSIQYYLATEDNRECDDNGVPQASQTASRWYTRQVGTTFSGVIGSAAARVVESVSCVQLGIEDLRALKLADLDAYALERLYLTVQSTTAPNRWIVLDQRQRERFSSIGLTLGDRVKDRTLAEDSSAGSPVTKPINTYWAKDPTIRLLKASDGSTELQAVSEVPWGQVLKDMAIKDQTDEDAALACRNDILAETNWTALRDIDITSYPWEPAYGD